MLKIPNFSIKFLSTILRLSASHLKIKHATWQTLLVASAVPLLKNPHKVLDTNVLK